MATASSTMIHILQDNVRIQHDLVAALALDVRDEPDAAAVVLVGRIVQPMLFRVSHALSHLITHPFTCGEQPAFGHPLG